MPFTGPGLYVINSVAFKGPLSYSPESPVLTVIPGGGPGAIFKISKGPVQDTFTIQSDKGGEPYYAHIEPTPPPEYPLVAVNDKEPFLWKIIQSNENEEYAVMTAEGPYVPRVWLTNPLGGPPPLVMVDRDDEAPQQRFFFTRVEF